ncbi:hypothetical protein VTK73DRAFT_2368 [Phialemonium thermophilum]|uniref:Carboxylesterase type B domain-containing protein n=1 Tax=Phialemonium thermophilum TaxID=223376 RepID=A0ABR3X5D5_9PEZI
MTGPDPIEVTGGLIQGVPSSIVSGITVYKGIPYAAPPVGPNRFREPQPVVPWTGVRVCDTNGPLCPQLAPDPKYPNILKGVPQSEDCLYLNVHVPDEAAHGKHKPWPVYMWLHGGMFREGGSADPHYDGTGLAMKGVIVVVPVFRLGVFGFLAHPELSAESSSGTSGNMGILDAMQALRWIHDNIAKFDGDPSRVTVGGQSSGAAMTQIVLLSPLAEGLLHGVTIQSGTRSYREPSLSNAAPSYRQLKDAEEDGARLLAELGLASVAELREYADLDRLVALGLRKDTRMWGPPPLFRAVLDGYVFPKTYAEIMDAGPPNDVPVVTGQNSHEGGVYNEPRFTTDDLRECVEARLGPHGNGIGSEAWVRRFYETYSPADEALTQPLECWNRSARDATRINIALWAREYHQKTTSPVFGYYFTHVPQPWHGWKPDYSLPKVPGYTHAKGPLFGAHHNAEMAYVFNSMVANDLRPWTEEDRIMGDKISTLWANFCKYGNPNGKEEEGEEGRPEGVPEWPSLTDRPDILLELGGRFRYVPVAEPEAIAFWTDYIASQKAW